VARSIKQQQQQCINICGTVIKPTWNYQCIKRLYCTTSSQSESSI